MVGKNNSATIAQVASALNPKLVDMPTLDIAGAVNNYYQGKDYARKQQEYEDEQSRRQAFADAIANNEDLSDTEKALYTASPEDYAKYLQGKTDFDNTMAQMAKQNEYNIGMENLKNSNAYGLAKYQAGLDNQAKQNELELKLKGIQSAVDSGEITPQQATLLRLGTSAKTLGIGGANGGKETTEQKEQAKRDMQKKDFEETKPTVVSAMQRAYTAANSGNGLGGIGGTAWNPASWFGKESNQNRADIENANNQMNGALRKQLASSGLTGGELNSEAEAKAYRYTISPTDNEEIIKRKMENFAVDVLGEDPSVLQQKNYKSKYGLE